MKLESINLYNKLEQTPLSPTKSLVPLYEAIANSFYAIKEAKISNGRIVVSIQRSTEQLPLIGDMVPNQPITGFVIEDNGVGFTDENLESFRIAYTPRRRKVGGKGIGRIMWLKAFERAEIDSIYQQGKKRFHRKFTFGVNDDSEPSTTESTADCRTIVRLVNYTSEYKCPTGYDTVARHIIAHFLAWFILDGCPEIRLKDDYEQTDESLNRYFKQRLNLGTKTKNFQLGKHKFKIEHVFLAALPETQHEFHYCACNRSVQAHNANVLIPSLRGHLPHASGKPFVYAAYVSGDLLESTVDEPRGRFTIPDEKSLFDTNGQTTWQAITRKVGEKANEYLADYLTPLREKNNKRIIEYIQDKEPKYRPLLKHRPQWLDRIPPTTPTEDLGFELYKLWKEYDLELMKDRPKPQRKDATSSSIEARKAKFSAFLTQWNDQGMAKLADYIIHRKATLEFLADSLELVKTDEYAAEDQIHKIICPMKTTSDDVPPEQMNLWIIDERLNYHAYMASDKPMNTLEAVTAGTTKRSDLIMFNRALSFTDRDFSSIVIVEFKRPMRNDYSDKENPIKQVYEYVRILRSGDATRATTAKGRPLPANLDSTPFYAYIICDITPNLKKFMEDYAFMDTPDLEGFYLFHPKHQVYIEIMSLNKLLSDARKRNQAFFDKLNLHLTPPAHEKASHELTGL